MRSQGEYKKGGTVDKIYSSLKASGSKDVLKMNRGGGGCEEMGSSLDLEGRNKLVSFVERSLLAAASQTWLYLSHLMGI